MAPPGPYALAATAIAYAVAKAAIDDTPPFLYIARHPFSTKQPLYFF